MNRPPERRAWLIPVRVILREVNTATIFADAWDPDTPILYPSKALPEDVTKALRAGEPLVVAEARVNLAAETPGDVVGEIIRALPVPSDKELGF